MQLVRKGKVIGNFISLANNMFYDNTKSKLGSKNVQDAIDELNTNTKTSISEINDTIDDLSQSFQDGCNKLVADVTAKGVTPDSNSPDDIIAAYAEAFGTSTGGTTAGGSFTFTGGEISTGSLGYADFTITNDWGFVPDALFIMFPRISGGNTGIEMWKANVTTLSQTSFTEQTKFKAQLINVTQNGCTLRVWGNTNNKVTAESGTVYWSAYSRSSILTPGLGQLKFVGSCVWMNGTAQADESCLSDYVTKTNNTTYTAAKDFEALIVGSYFRRDAGTASHLYGSHNEVQVLDVSCAGDASEHDVAKISVKTGDTISFRLSSTVSNSYTNVAIYEIL